MSESKSLTVTLTDRAPVRIQTGEWPLIASAKDWDNTYECQANRTWTLRVRAHGDGRTIVYGVYTTQWQNESDKRGGEVIDPGADIPAAVKRVAEYLGFTARLADECIADLPAQDI